VEEEEGGFKGSAGEEMLNGEMILGGEKNPTERST